MLSLCSSFPPLSGALFNKACRLSPSYLSLSYATDLTLITHSRSRGLFLLKGVRVSSVLERGGRARHEKGDLEEVKLDLCLNE